MASTYFLAKLIGLLLLTTGASMFFQKAVFIKVLDDLTRNRSALFMVGILLLLGGLSMVITHNLWTAGFLPLVITLIGWMTIVRGILSIFVPGERIARLIRQLKFPEYARLYAILVLVIGAYLTLAGFGA